MIVQVNWVMFFSQLRNRLTRIFNRKSGCATKQRLRASPQSRNLIAFLVVAQVVAACANVRV